jgi:hypothetical protein
MQPHKEWPRGDWCNIFLPAVFFLGQLWHNLMAPIGLQHTSPRCHEWFADDGWTKARIGRPLCWKDKLKSIVGWFTVREKQCSFVEKVRPKRQANKALKKRVQYCCDLGAWTLWNLMNAFDGDSLSLLAAQQLTKSYGCGVLLEFGNFRKCSLVVLRL